MRGNAPDPTPHPSSLRSATSPGAESLASARPSDPTRGEGRGSAPLNLPRLRGRSERQGRRPKTIRVGETPNIHPQQPEPDLSKPMLGWHPPPRPSPINVGGRRAAMLPLALRSPQGEKASRAQLNLPRMRGRCRRKLTESRASHQTPPHRHGFAAPPLPRLRQGRGKGVTPLIHINPYEYIQV